VPFLFYFKPDMTTLRRFLLLGLLAQLVSCASAPKPGETTLLPTPVTFSQRVEKALPQFHHLDLTDEIPVFLVSSRNLVENPGEIDPFGNSRSRFPTPHFAVASVKIGEGLNSDQILEATLNEPREVEPKVALTKIRLVSEQNGSEQSEQEWIAAIRAQLAKQPQRNLAIYIHGYNTHLISNTEFAAEISHLTGRNSTVISFEWPSSGSVFGYFKDKGNAAQGARLFRRMLATLGKETDAHQINILAHSAGNPIAIQALTELRLMDRDLTPEQLHQKYRIGNVVLAAPDMDLMTFFNSVGDRFHELPRNVVVYTSSSDKALGMSSFLFGEPRLGRALGGLEDWEKKDVRSSGIEIVDVSYAESRFGSWLGHSYLHRDPWVSGDITLFMRGVDAAGRGLVRSPDHILWEFPADHVERLLQRSPSNGE
jgi:esterase/lipase superfamily enzyme